MENPYAATERGVDTLGLIGEKRLRIRIRRVFPEGRERFGETAREWRLVGGSVGWRESLLKNANLFLDAGLIDYVRPAGTGVDEPSDQTNDWTPVFLTRAGKYLLRLWCRAPFVVVPTEEIPERVDRAAEALSTAYVEESGLLEDAPDRYAQALYSHAERVTAALLAVGNVGGVWQR